MRGIVELDYSVHDKVDLEFTFREPVGREGAVPEAVWAIVSKQEMKRLRNDRWDLVRFSTCREARETDVKLHLHRLSRRPPRTTRFRRPWSSCLVRP